MKIEGYLIDNAMTRAIPVILVDMKPNARFRLGGSMLKTSKGTQLLVYGAIQPLPKGRWVVDELVKKMKEQCNGHGEILLLRGYDDQAIEDAEAMMEVVRRE